MGRAGQLGALSLLWRRCGGGAVVVDTEVGQLTTDLIMGVKNMRERKREDGDGRRSEEKR